MTTTRTRPAGRRPALSAAGAALSVVLLAGACGTPEPGGDEPVTATAGAPPAATSPLDVPEGSTDGLTAEETAFLEDLGELRFPTRGGRDTAVEVGHGICRRLADGVPATDALDGLEPLVAAFSARTRDLDADEVAALLVEKSREHLCR